MRPPPPLDHAENKCEKMEKMSKKPKFFKAILLAMLGYVQISFPLFLENSQVQIEPAKNSTSPLVLWTVIFPSFAEKRQFNSPYEQTLVMLLPAQVLRKKPITLLIMSLGALSHDNRAT